MSEHHVAPKRAFLQNPMIWFVALGCIAYAVATQRIPTIGEWIWVASLVLTIIIRAPHARVAKTTAVTEQRFDIAERVALSAMFLCMVALPTITVMTPLFDRFAYALPPWATWVGAGLAFAGLLLFWRSHADLGRNWSPALEVRAAHTLVTRGVYRAVRHPMYAAIWLQSLAQPLLIQNWIGGALILAACTLLYFSRVPKEEAMMADQFGADWTAYAAKTGRIIPGVRWL